MPLDLVPKALAIHGQDFQVVAEEGGVVAELVPLRRRPGPLFLDIDDLPAPGLELGRSG